MSVHVHCMHILSGLLYKCLYLYMPTVSGPDPEGAFAGGGGGRPSMAAERAPPDLGAVPRWGSGARGYAPGCS